ncbi:MAG: M14 family metallopeptidase [Gemmatimonadota bacterium]|nr:M14 family metallopeptidase [Gemmatimonadota bacterium]
MTDRAADHTLPELTRPLRALGSARWLRDADHARFFTPLLAARRNAARVRTAEGHVAAFQAERLRRALNEAVEQMAAARHPKSAPDRRALVAWVTDAGAPVWSALDALEEHGLVVTRAGTPVRGAAWNAWVGTLQRLFLAADSWWVAIVAQRDGAVGRGRGARSLGLALLLALAPLALAATPLQGQQHLTYRVSGLTPGALQAAGFDVVGTDGGAAVVIVDAAELTRLQGLGGQAQQLTAPGTDARRLMQMAAVAATPVVYRPYDDPRRGIRAWVDSLAAANPRVSVDTVGLSFERRPILAVKIGPRGDSPARPNVLFVATHHAREWAATEMAVRLITRLATATDARTDSLVNQRDIWVVPVVNPDGYQYTFTNDRLWRKNRRPMPGGVVGVDLNRNHSNNWGLDNFGSSPTPSSEIYRGPAAASEPETAALQAFHVLHPPVIAITYHTYAGLLLFPPGARNGVLAADLDAYRVLGGTNAHPAAIDRLPGSARSFYSPGTAWMLYPTNGEYTDWASATFGTIAINPELTSGYGATGFYGFEFPDSESLLQQLFTDNLPFALDAIEMARDPAAYRSPSTGLRADRWVLESGAQSLRVRVPAALAATTALTASGQPVPVSLDSASGGKYARRLVSLSGGNGRPQTISVAQGAERVTWTQLFAAGAETGDATWSPPGFAFDSSQRFAGRAAYRLSGNLELRSPLLSVPANIDTVSLNFWTRFNGDGYSQSPFGLVRVSTDSARTWDVVARMAGAAAEWYPEDVRIGGVRGKGLIVSFIASNLPWWLDEITLFAHGAKATGGEPGEPAVRLRPSANPVRGNAVTFVWPYAGRVGRLMVYDFTGRLVWTHHVRAGDADATWALGAQVLPNGAYLVLAESGSERTRVKLFVARETP